LISDNIIFHNFVGAQNINIGFVTQYRNYLLILWIIKRYTLTNPPGSTSKHFLQFSKNKFIIADPVIDIFQGGLKSIIGHILSPLKYGFGFDRFVNILS